MAIVNAKLMAALATEFNIGCDVLGKGNRHIEKHLGAENMSGDTIHVPIMDSGKVYKNLDLTAPSAAGELTVNRAAVPITVTPYTSAAAATAQELTLSIKEPDLMQKRVANMVDEINLDAYRCLYAESAAFVAGTDDDRVIRNAAFGAEASCVGSKIAGKTYGLVHPTTWNRLVSAMQANFGANSNQGSKLYINELGNFMGFDWSKGSDTNTITAVNVATGLGTVTLTRGSKVLSYTGTAYVGTVDGETSQPFTIAGVYNVDALGKRTSRLKTFYAKWNATTSKWELTREAQFDGPLCWMYNATMSGTATATLAAAAGNVLTSGTTYLSPAVIWKSDDFLVAVKGLEAFHGKDSYTVPTAFSEKGILPLRGTCDTNIITSQSIFRVDVMAGFKMYQGLSNASIWIPA